jgi:hypothetical protein
MESSFINRLVSLTTFEAVKQFGQGNHEMILLAVFISPVRRLASDADQCRVGFLAGSETNISRRARLQEWMTSWQQDQNYAACRMVISAKTARPSSVNEYGASNS